MKELLKPYNIIPIQTRKLEGYGSINYWIQTSDNGQYVLKVYKNFSELDLVQEENRILLALASKVSFELPTPLTNSNESYTTSYPDNSFSRLLSFVNGKFIGEIDHCEGLLASLGETVGKLDKALSYMESRTIEARRLHWDLQYCLMDRSKAIHIKNKNKKKLVDYFFDQFEYFALPEFPGMRHSLIHCDLNDWNILSKSDKVTGVIDFGDMSFSPVINELAIALTYVILGKKNPIETALPVIHGYQKHFPLMENEIKLLKYLIPARLAASVCNSSESKARTDDTDYILVSEKPAWELLEKWISFNPLEITDRFLDAAGFPVKNHLKRKKTVVEKRAKYTGRSLGISYKNPVYMHGSAFQYMYDFEGNSYLDVYNNIPHVGHCHPRISKAISTQVRLLNTNTRYLYDSLTRYSEKLLGYFPEKLNKIFYVNSGSAASDLAVRMAETHTDRFHHLVLEHGYHGNTRTGINISSYKFEGKGGRGRSSIAIKLPLPNLFNSSFSSGREYALDAVERITTLSNKGIHPASFIAEPVSGCGGQVPLAPDYLKILNNYLSAHDILVIIDEVQTGFGRLGSHFWGFEMHGIVPDLVVLGKPMGNGHPIAAVVTTEAIAESFANGMEFFSSFGGNPVSTEAALAVLEVIEQEQLQEHAHDTGIYFKDQLINLGKTYKTIGDIRGFGLFLGIEFTAKDQTPNTSLANHVKNSLKDRFILAGTDGPFDNVLKIKPPLCFNRSNADIFCENLESILKKAPGLSL